MMYEGSGDGVATSTTMKYTVYIDDNYHYMDESERVKAGNFRSLSKAIAKAKRIVDRSLAEAYEKGMPVEELTRLYIMFGEDPFIVGGPPKSDFSARDYARTRCEEMCGGKEG